MTDEIEWRMRCVRPDGSETYSTHGWDTAKAGYLAYDNEIIAYSEQVPA